MSSRLVLYGERGWGSAIVEAQLVWYGLDFDYRATGDLFKDPSADDELAAVNPLRQIPTLILEDRTVMTESAAITLLLAERAGLAGALAPAAGDPARAAFLRWLVFIVANVYPTYTYADDPARFVEPANARGPFKDAVTEYAKRLYRQLDAEAAEPWFTGERLTALDVYLATMVAWRPYRPWFDDNAPRLAAIARRVYAEPRFGDVWRLNFPVDGA
ncbi:MAG: glutathione S-transferase family protein [Parvularculaceae bacterium]